MAELNQLNKKRMEDELRTSKNMKQAFAVLGKYYDLENCTPGFISKNIMIAKLKDAVKFLRAQPFDKFT